MESILLHSQKQQDWADPVNRRRQPEQVDAYLRDRIKAVQAPHNQQEQMYDLSRKVLRVRKRRFRTGQVFKHAVSATRPYLGRHL